MIGLLLLFASWLLLRLEGRSLRELGFDFPARRMREFALGFLVTGLFVTVQQLGCAAATHDSWQLNPAFTWGLLGQQLRWTLNSVLYEELLFRGYLLYQAIRFLGERRGVWLGAALFGVYHWFSFGVIGNPVAMVYVLVLTGAFGGMCALAFAKTKSIAAPIGLHLGWNLISYVIFSTGPSGAALLLPASGVARVKADGLAGVLLGPVLQLVLVGVMLLVLIKLYPCPKAENKKAAG